MRHTRLLAALLCLALGAAAVYVSHDSVRSADPGGTAPRVETLGELVKFNKNDLLKFRNFGKKSLTELDELLVSMSLNFGMDIGKYKLDMD